MQRLGKAIGVVGFIICRKIVNKKKCLKTQQDAYRNDKLIIVLEDDDIINLFNFKCENDRDGLLEYLDEKAKAVILSK